MLQRIFPFFKHARISLLEEISEKIGHARGHGHRHVKITLVLFSFLLALPLNADAEPPHKQQITYLMQSKEYAHSIELYQNYQKHLGRHDFEVIQEMALILLEEGARSDDPQRQLVSIFATGMGGISSSLDVLEAGIKSPIAETQVAAIQLLGRLQDDRSDELLVKAMSSPFFMTRLEAAYQLSVRKHRTIVGQLEALMHRLPDEMRFLFPEFFALIGTTDAITVLRHLMDEKIDIVRTEAILSAARHGRDDLLPIIRSLATHLNRAEQEACASALGFLKDSQSQKMLTKLSSSSSIFVKLASLKSLYMLGDLSSKDPLLEIAKQGDLFAISLLGEIPGSEDLLSELIEHKDIQVRFNATCALLMRRDPRALFALPEFLIRDSRGLGFSPQFSTGRSLMAWKVIPSAAQQKMQSNYDLVALSLSVREMLLRGALELPEDSFISLAEEIFDSRQSDLIPLLVELLENLSTPAAIDLLKQKSHTSGAPLIRAYCNLALFRLKENGPYETLVKNWIQKQKCEEMIRFRPVVARSSYRLPESSFELTLEESSRLLIDSLQALADRHEEMSIDMFLTLLKEGNPKNRYIIAGLLLHAIQ